MSETSSIYSNIFKSSAKKNSMRYLNKLVNEDVFYEIHNNNITKIFFTKNKFDWEIYVSLILDKLDLDIIPEIININYGEVSCINYNTSNLVSLRNLFESNNNFHYIINELLSFLKSIKNKNVLIGNLHIDTIYVNKETMKFYILDISNTIFTELNRELDMQSLYISLYDTKIQNKIIKYFDEQMMNLNISKYSFTHDIIDAYTN